MSTLSLTVGPLALFAFVASITPGPEQPAADALRRHVRRAPLAAGTCSAVQAGFAALVVLSHLGVAALLLALPGHHDSAALGLLPAICCGWRG